MFDELERQVAALRLRDHDLVAGVLARLSTDLARPADVVAAALDFAAANASSPQRAGALAAADALAAATQRLDEARQDPRNVDNVPLRELLRSRRGRG